MFLKISATDKKSLVYHCLIALSLTFGLVIFQPFGTNFRYSDSIILALSYSVIASVIIYLHHRYLEFWLTKKLSRSSDPGIYARAIMYVILLTTISVSLSAYYYLWSCRCEEEAGWVLLIGRFMLRTFGVGFFVILIIEVSKRIPQFGSTWFSDTLPHSLPRDNEIGVQLSNVLYVKAEGNYVSMVSQENDKAQKKLVRLSLNRVKEYDSEDVFIFCHRSYLVNRTKLERLAGPKKKAFLTIKECDHQIPVSLTYYDSIKQLVLSR